MLSVPLLHVDIQEIAQRLWLGLKACDFTGYDTFSHLDVIYRICGDKRDSCAWKMRRHLVSLAFDVCAPFMLRRFDAPVFRNVKGIALALSALVAQRHWSEPFGDMAECRSLADQILAQRLPESGLWSVTNSYVIRDRRVPKDSICLINSLFCAQALRDWHDLTGDPVAGGAWCKAAISILRHQHRISLPSGVCFSYSNYDDYFVHNANLLAAELLLSAPVREDDFTECLEIGLACIAYSLDHLERFERPPYSGPPTENLKYDCYHTGYVLRALDVISQLQVAVELIPRIQAYVNKTLRVWRRDFVVGTGVWDTVGGRRMQTHSLADVLLMYVHFAERYPDLFDKTFIESVNRSFDRVWMPSCDGFANRVVRFPLGLRRLDPTPMPRWASAWMLLALCRLGK